jgi:hypothetical protein
MHSPRDATAATSRARCASYCGASAEDFNIAFSFAFPTYSPRSLPARNLNSAVATSCGRPTKNHPNSIQLIIALPSRRRATPYRHPADYENASLRLDRPSLLHPTLHRQIIRNGPEIRTFAHCACRRVASRIRRHTAPQRRTHMRLRKQPLLTCSQDGPPPQYQGGPQPPQQAYGGDQSRGDQSQAQGYYNQQPPNQYGSPNPYQQQGQGYGPPQGQYGPPQGQYGQPDQQQGMYYQQGPPPQGQGMYPQQQQKGGAGGGLFAGLCAGLACCCCLDCLF